MKPIKALDIPKITDIKAPNIPVVRSIKALGLDSTKNSGDYTADFYGLEKNETVNFPTIMRYLKSGIKIPLNWTEFKGVADLIKTYSSIGMDGVLEVEREIDKTVPFTYINSYKQKIQTSISCGINKRIDNIDTHMSVSFSINSTNKSINCKIAYFYINTEQYRVSVNSTSSDTDFEVNEKYVALKFFSENITDIYHFVKEIQNNDPEWFKLLVNSEYVPLIERCKDVKQLMWLYQNAPDFTLAALKPETLWKNICSFYNYDTNGAFSFVRDASPMLMKALFAFNTPTRISFLMEKLSANQDFVINLYDALDDEIIFMGEKIPCKIAFISVISSFSHVSRENFNFTNNLFSVGRNSFVNLEKIQNSQQQSDKGKYKVEQKEKIGTSLSPSIGGGVSVPYDNYITTRIVNLLPLDIILVLEEETQSLLFVPALFLYDKQHQRNMEAIAASLRLGINMLAIAMAIETLGGSLLAAEGAEAITLWGMLTALEGAVALGDLGVQLNKDKLTKEFLDIWENIYMTSGYATATTGVVQGLYKIGGKILAQETRAEVKNFVMSCMVKIMLEREISNFSKSTFKVLMSHKELIQATNGVINEAKAKLMYQYGMFLIEVEYKGKIVTPKKIIATIDNEVAIVYKGEIITHANKSEFYKKTNSLLKHLKNPTEFIKVAEELLVYSKRYPVSLLKDLVTEAQAFYEFGELGKTLVQQVNSDVARTLNTLNKKIIDDKTMLSGFIYRKDNIRHISTETNFLKQEIYGGVYKKFIENLHPTLKARLDKHIARLKMDGVLATPSDIIRAGAIGSHGEIRALDKLLTVIDPEAKLGDAVFQDIIGYNRFLRQEANKIQPPCVHCYYLTHGIRFIGF